MSTVTRIASDGDCVSAAVVRDTAPRHLEIRLDLPAERESHVARLTLETDDSTMQRVTVGVRARIGLPLAVSPHPLPLNELRDSGRAVGVTFINDGDKPVRLLYCLAGAAVAELPARPIAPHSQCGVSVPLLRSGVSAARGGGGGHADAMMFNIHRSLPEQPIVSAQVR